MGRPKLYENPNSKYDRLWKWYLADTNGNWYKSEFGRESKKTKELRERIRNHGT